MSENYKRFVILERKDVEYIFDTENTPAFWNPNTDMVELIGDSLSEAEIIDLLNQLNDKNNELEDRIDKLEEDNVRYHLGRGEPQLEDPRFIVTTCPYEICDTMNNHYYWLEMKENVKEVCRVLNELYESNNKLKNDNQRLKNKLNNTALELVNCCISMGKAVEISEMNYHDFLKYCERKGKPMELRL